MKDKLFITVNSMFLNTQAEIDELSSRGEIEWIDAKMLFMSIISLNVLPFIAFPIINLLMSGVGDKRDEFLNQRKEENVKTIMNRIQIILFYEQIIIYIFICSSFALGYGTNT
jgi:hypothetical protein